jgi:hypothetical protein
MYRAGMKVVCVNANPCPHWGILTLVKDRIYMVVGTGVDSFGDPALELLDMAQILWISIAGGQNGQHWTPGTQASGGSAQGTNHANVGTGGAGGSRNHTYPHRSCPEAGIRAGEIIAYRAWRIEDGDNLLHSMAMEYIWSPRSVEKAGQCDVNCRNCQEIDQLHPYGGNGLYAFKDINTAKKEFDFFAPIYPVVFGEVALWGEVYEHEHGYRAQYAKVTRIMEVHEKLRFSLKFWKPRTIDILRRKYGVGG